MLKALLNSSVLRTAAVLLAVFCVAAWIIPTPALILILNYVLIAVAVAVVVTFLPAIWDAIRMRSPDYVGQLTLGIGISFASIIVMRSWIGTMRIAGEDWSEHVVVAFYIYLAILGGVLHITAPSSMSPSSHRRSRVTLALAMGLGGLVAGLMIGMQWGAGRWG